MSQGKEVKFEVWSLCPLRSPTFPPGEEQKVYDPSGKRPPPAPEQVLGPCLYAGCGFFKITEIADGQIKAGMCGIRFIGEVMNSIAGSLETLIQIQKAKTVEIPLPGIQGS